MLDARIRVFLDPPLNELGSRLARQGIKPNTITLSGFLLGLVAMPLIAFHYYSLALVFILLNRFFDGLDGAIARQVGPTDTGAYLDIVLDFVFYSSIPFAFALAQPQHAIFSALLIFSFIGTGSSFLAFAIFAEKRGINSEQQGKKSIYYLAGLAEGFETVAVLVLMCLIPAWFWLIALIFAMVCWLSALLRILQVAEILND